MMCRKTVYFLHLELLANKISYATKSLQSCPTLCDPIDGSSPGSPIPGILQARTLEWVAISFSSAWKWKVKVKLLNCVRPSATPWTAALQAPLSVGFSRQEYWSGVPLPSPSINANSQNESTDLSIILTQKSLLWHISSFFWCISYSSSSCSFCLDWGLAQSFNSSSWKIWLRAIKT